MPESPRTALVIDPPRRSLGALAVRRALPGRRRRTIGPFIFFDHMGPAVFPPGSGLDVRAHPHIGLATVTYLFEGEILHRDSLGYVQRIRPGAVNWMTAGRGIVHSEKVTAEILAAGQTLHGIQTWMALPKAHAEIEPSFVHYPADSIPETRLDGVNLRVIIGSAYGATSPVQATSETIYVQADIDSGQSLTLPAAEELGIYVVEGAIDIDNQRIEAGQLAVTGEGGDAAVALADSRLMLCGGDAIDGQRIIWWNFVASDPARIERAKSDWLENRFGSVPGETDFIPLPEN